MKKNILEVKKYRIKWTPAIDTILEKKTVSGRTFKQDTYERLT